MKKTILYWRGIIGDKDALAQYGDTITKLAQGELSSLNFEKLRGHDVYSVRVNREDRLLFKTVIIKGEPCLVLLDVVLNHDYHKSKFLKPSVLKEYMDQKEALLEDLIFEEVLDKTQLPLPLVTEDLELNYAPVDYFNRSFLLFNESQENVLASPMPLVVGGAPGSGKSCSALSLLVQYVDQTRHDETPKKMLYLANAEALVASMKKMWKALPCSAEHVVEFKTYAELLAEHVDLKENELVGEARFQEWLAAYKTVYENLQKVLTKGKKPAKDAESIFAKSDLIYQEFRVISSYTAEEYLALGARESIFKLEDEKKLLISAYNSYLKYLDTKNLINPDFYPMATEATYDMVVVDESQNLSRLQLRCLDELAKNRQICFFADSHQSHNDRISVRPFLKNKLGIDAYIELPSSYRCPASVLRVANAVIKIKNQLRGGKADKQEYVSISAGEVQKNKEGRVEWLTKDNERLNDIITRNAESTEFAVVTHEEFIEEAKKRFKTPLVFTPKQIIGLEYPNVMAYQILDKPSLYAANKSLQKKSGDKKNIQHLAKRDADGKEEYGPELNELFITFTRATQTLYIVQEINHDTRLLAEPLLTASSSHIASSSKQVIIPAEEKSPVKTDWAAEYKKLMMTEGTQSQALDILNNKLGGRKPDEAMGSSSLPDPQEIKLAPVGGKRAAPAPRGKGKSKKKGGGKVLATTKVATSIGKSQSDNEKTLAAWRLNFDKKTIASFFSRSNPLKQLFKEENNTCLFNEVFGCEEWRKVFLNYLNTSRNFKLFLKSLTSYGLDTIADGNKKSPLDWMLASNESVNFLDYLFSNKYQKMGWSVLTLLETITRPRLIIDEQPAKPMLHWLFHSKNAGGIITTLLINIIENNKMSLEYAHAFLFALTDHAHPSTIYALSYYSNTENALIRFLDSLILLNLLTPELVHILSLTLPIDDPLWGDTSALYWLTHKLTLRDTALRLFDELIQKDLINAEFVHAFCLTTSESVGIHSHLSPLFCLSTYAAGQIMLGKLFNEFHRKNLVTAEFVHTLCLARTGCVKLLQLFLDNTQDDELKSLISEKLSIVSELEKEPPEKVAHVLGSNGLFPQKKHHLPLVTDLSSIRKP